MIYSFPDTGHFEISLVVINSFGCQSVKTKNLVIYLEDKVFVPNFFHQIMMELMIYLKLQ